MILDPVTLTSHTPLLNSKTRWVYEHPDTRDVLIKVHMSRMDQKPAQGLKGWFARQEDHFMYTTGMLRELKQFVESRYRDYGDIVHHIAPVYGVVDTDLGLGLLVAAARDAQGNLAPTVRKLMQQRAMTVTRQQKLEQVLQAIEKTDLVIGDLNAENIVLQGAGREDERFVIIDGLGERTWIPTQSLIKAVGKRRKQAFVAKMRRRLAGLAHG